MSNDSERAAEIIRQATDPDRRLPGEDPDRSDDDDVRHWVAVYDELLRFKREVIAIAVKNAAEFLEPSGVEIGLDIEVMRIQAGRLQYRANLWRSRLERST